MSFNQSASFLSDDSEEDNFAVVEFRFNDKSYTATFDVEEIIASIWEDIVQNLHLEDDWMWYYGFYINGKGVSMMIYLRRPTRI